MKNFKELSSEETFDIQGGSWIESGNWWEITLGEAFDYAAGFCSGILEGMEGGNVGCPDDE